MRVCLCLPKGPQLPWLPFWGRSRCAAAGRGRGAAAGPLMGKKRVYPHHSKSAKIISVAPNIEFGYKFIAKKYGEQKIVMNRYRRDQALINQGGMKVF